jgi:putative hydrolase of the HAD superfamily
MKKWVYENKLPNTCDNNFKVIFSLACRKLPMSIKAVLFDMFDTLMMIKRNNDFYSPSLMRMYKFLNAQGIDVPFTMFEQAYIKARDQLYKALEADLTEPHFNVRVSETLKALGYNHDISSPLVMGATEQFCDEFMTFVTPDPEAKTVLQSLQGKYKLGIVSNFAIPECVQKLLKHHGFDGFFDVVVVSAAVNSRKPSPEIFSTALQALVVSASETVVVGDTINSDVEGAKVVGAKSVYIKRRNEPEAERVHPDREIKRLSELPLTLQELDQFLKK